MCGDIGLVWGFEAAGDDENVGTPKDASRIFTRLVSDGVFRPRLGGTFFGPFINRYHFATWMNLATGAGLRSFDRTMPEEINRILTDAISNILFCTEKSGVDNLLREGIPPARIHFVGNVMIDTLLRHRERAAKSDILSRMALTPREYVVLTLHRPSNVDDPRVFSELLDVLEIIQRERPIVFPVHPRTQQALARHGLESRLGPCC